MPGTVYLIAGAHSKQSLNVLPTMCQRPEAINMKLRESTHWHTDVPTAGGREGIGNRVFDSRPQFVHGWTILRQKKPLAIQDRQGLESRVAV